MHPQWGPGANLSRASMDLTGTLAYFLIGYFCIPSRTFQYVSEASCSEYAFLQRRVWSKFFPTQLVQTEAKKEMSSARIIFPKLKSDQILGIGVLDSVRDL